MKCVIPGNNIRVFGRSIHSLSKIGEELYIEPLDHGLALRTVNSSRSAYACFLFAPSFFQHYDDGSGDISSQDSDDTLRCKIAMKSIMTVFRSLSTLEKSVERCKIRLNMKDSRLVFQLYCRHGIVKTHNLAFIECETLQAVFSKDMCPNALTASSKLLCDAVMNFQNNQEEVTLIVNPEKIVLKNYVEDEPDPNKVMHTNLSLEPDEFDNCQIGVDTEVTFCLKELRAILAFTEATTLPLTLHFETAGRPIVFTIDSDSTFEGNFVLATLADQQTQSQAPTPATKTQKRTQSRTSKAAQQRSKTSYMSHSKPGNNGDTLLSSRKTGSSNDLERSQRMESAYDELMNDDDDFDAMMIQNDTTMVVPKNSRTNPSESLDKSENISGNNTVKKVNARGDNNVKYVQSSSPVAGCSKSSEESPVIPILGSKVKIADTSIIEHVHMADDANEEDDDELVPGTPPAKRFRSLFFGSSQASQTQTQSKPTDLSTSRVLAQDSDED